MNKKITILATLLIGFGLLVSSCNDFLDVNKDPNHPSNVTPGLILPAGLANTAGYISAGTGSLNTLGNLMMMSWSQDAGFAWYGTAMAYNVTTGFYSGLFSVYLGALQQYANLATLKKKKYGYFKAIGLIMEAYHYQILVDLYGKIPYTKAELRQKNITPEYDKGQVVYDKIVKGINKAIDLIEKGLSGTASKQFVKPGIAAQLYESTNVYPSSSQSTDHIMEHWAAFANSVKIRILTRESGVKSASYINKQLRMIADNNFGVITENAVINPGYKTSSGKLNPYWATFGKDSGGNTTLTHGATCATTFVVNWMVGHTHDPRFRKIYEVPDKGAKGVNQGGIMPGDKVSLLKPPHISNLDMTKGQGVLRGPTQSTVIMTEAEVLLNLALLKVNGFNISGISKWNSAKNNYRHAVISSFKYLYLPDSTKAAAIPEAKAYLNQKLPAVNWASSPNKKNAIMVQKWIATMGLTAAQSWFGYSRTGLPNASIYGLGPARHVPPLGTNGWPISLDAGGHVERPVRLLYPPSEFSRNGANVPPIKNTSDAFGPQNKIFWAK